MRCLVSGQTKRNQTIWLTYLTFSTIQTLTRAFSQVLRCLGSYCLNITLMMGLLLFAHVGKRERIRERKSFDRIQYFFPVPRISILGFQSNLLSNGKRTIHCLAISRIKERKQCIESVLSCCFKIKVNLFCSHFVAIQRECERW